MKAHILSILLLAGAIAHVSAQGKKSVVIGTMIDKPNAVLIINPPNSDQGFLIPQLTTAQRISIAPVSPVDDGLMVFDVTEQSFYYWSTTWVKGLGDPANQLLSYDASTQTLTLSGGGSVTLATLKEIPSPTGNAGKYLTTDGATVSWGNITGMGDITGVTAGPGLIGGATSGDANLAVNTDGSTISINGSNQLQLSNGAVTTAKIATNSVNSSHIVDGSITSTDILDNTILTNDLSNNAVTGPKIANSAVNTTHIATGGNDKVLTTNGAGVVGWADRATFTDDQNLTFAGNTLSIENGTGVNLSANGQVTGLIDNLVITPGAANQVLTTNAAATGTQWATPAGDVTGTVAASIVGKIQGRDVSNTAPNTGDALIWNGTAWVPSVVSISPTTQYYSIDPSSFQALEPNGNNNSILGLFSSDNTYTFARGNSREIIAPIELPHGATIQNVTLYYVDNEVLGDVTARIMRKPFTGANQVLSTFSSLLVSLIPQSQDLPAIAAANRVVDNSTFTYRLHVIFGNLIDYGSAAVANLRVYAVRIEYTK